MVLSWRRQPRATHVVGGSCQPCAGSDRSWVEMNATSLRFCVSRCPNPAPGSHSTTWPSPYEGAGERPCSSRSRPPSRSSRWLGPRPGSDTMTRPQGRRPGGRSRRRRHRLRRRPSPPAVRRRRSSRRARRSWSTTSTSFSSGVGSTWRRCRASRRPCAPIWGTRSGRSTARFRSSPRRATGRSSASSGTGTRRTSRWGRPSSLWPATPMSAGSRSSRTHNEVRSYVAQHEVDGHSAPVPSALTTTSRRPKPSFGEATLCTRIPHLPSNAEINTALDAKRGLLEFSYLNRVSQRDESFVIAYKTDRSCQTTADIRRDSGHPTPSGSWVSFSTRCSAAASHFNCVSGTAARSNSSTGR